VRVIIALSFLVASAVATPAQYIMQPSLGGTYDYGTGSNPDRSEVKSSAKLKEKAVERRRKNNSSSDNGRMSSPRLRQQSPSDRLH
jgi:hypothetical protein